MSVARGSLRLVRHAPVTVTGVCYGHADVRARIPAERAAARIIADALASPPDRVWSTALRRCLGPARHVALAFRVPHEVDERLRELCFGRWEGRSWEALESDPSEGPALRRWMADWRREAPPDGERVEALARRVERWWKSLPPDEHHLVVTHAGTIRALRVSAEGWSWDRAMSTPVPHLTLQALPLPPKPSASLAATGAAWNP